MPEQTSSETTTKTEQTSTSTSNESKTTSEESSTKTIPPKITEGEVVGYSLKDFGAAINQKIDQLSFGVFGWLEKQYIKFALNTTADLMAQQGRLFLTENGEIR